MMFPTPTPGIGPQGSVGVTKYLLLVTMIMSQRWCPALSSVIEESPCRILYLKGEKTTLSNFPWPLFGKYYYLDNNVRDTYLYRQSGRQDSTVVLYLDTKLGWVLEERLLGGLRNRLLTGSDALQETYTQDWTYNTADNIAGYASFRSRGFHCVSQALFGFSQVYIGGIVFNGIPKHYQTLETCQQGCTADEECWAINWDFHSNDCFFLTTFDQAAVCKDVETDMSYKLEKAKDMVHYRRASRCPGDFCLIEGATRINCSHTCYSYPANKTIWECECDTGYSYCAQHGTCCDNNECSIGTDDCVDGQRCVNVPGRYSCWTCPVGYTADKARINCVDVNECHQRNGNCSQICNNTAGGYHCTCQPGYTLTIDNITCTENLDAGASLTSEGLIIPIAIGVAVSVALTLVILLIVIFICKRRKKEDASQETATNFVYGELEHLTRPQPTELSVRYSKQDRNNTHVLHDLGQGQGHRTTPGCNDPLLTGDQGQGHYSEISTSNEHMYSEPANVLDIKTNNGGLQNDNMRSSENIYAEPDNNIPGNSNAARDTDSKENATSRNIGHVIIRQDRDGDKSSPEDDDVHMVTNELYGSG